MKNLYNRVAVASVCTVLGFALGANTEAKAAILSLESTISSEIVDYSSDGLGNSDGLGDVSFTEFSISGIVKGPFGDKGQFNEFNIGSFSFAPSTVINSAVLQVEIYSIVGIDLGINTPTNPGSLGIFGYVGNGTVEVSDFEAGIFLNSVDISSSSTGDILSFDVSPFVNQRVSNGDAFAGFGIRALNFGGLYLNNYTSPGIKPRLIVETADVAEPVPEPTTIFGSALALGVGGWLKRKKSSQHNKTNSSL